MSTLQSGSQEVLTYGFQLSEMTMGPGAGLNGFETAAFTGVCALCPLNTRREKAEAGRCLQQKEEG